MPCISILIGLNDAYSIKESQKLCENVKGKGMCGRLRNQQSRVLHGVFHFFIKPIIFQKHNLVLYIMWHLSFLFPCGVVSEGRSYTML